jgi:anaerobic dimethyl sulfoxide reductase subunit B (iron-sulfur subunit)
MKRAAFYIDTSACAGCKTCQAACKDKNALTPGLSWRRIYEIEGGNWNNSNGVYTEKPFAYFISISCNNCEDAPCIDACPTTALHRSEDGFVLIDPLLCMGCNYCEWTCPYGALRMDGSRGIMTKCNFCIDLLYEGHNPACVDACPMRAIDFGYFEDISARRGTVNSLYPLPGFEMTKPGLVIKPHKDALKANNDNAIVNNLENY